MFPFWYKNANILLKEVSALKNRIKQVRKRLGLSLAEVGKGIGLATNTVSRYENGKREPKLETWQKLADFLGVSVSYLQGTAFNETDIFKIISQTYVDGDPFLVQAIDQHLRIVGMKPLKEVFSSDDLRNFTNDVENFFSSNFQFIFLVPLGKSMLQMEKSAPIEVIDYVNSIIDSVDTKLESTPISNLFDKKVNDELAKFVRDKDVFLRIENKEDIEIKVYKLASTLAKFANDIEDLPENSLTTPEKARKRLNNFVNSGGKSFE